MGPGGDGLMPPINRRNAARPDLLLPDQLGQGYQHWQEPLGDFGIFNGQFELGPGSGSPPGWPEGWELNPYTGGTITREAGGFAGNWCMKAGQAGTGRGGQLFSLRYIPVYEAEDYYIAGAFKGDTVNSQIYFGVQCYDAAKADLGQVWVVSAGTPGVTWHNYERRIGPTGDAAFIATTRYIRVKVILQYDNTLTGDYAYCDNIQFQQQKATVSPKIHLTDVLITEATETFTDHTAFTLWANSTLNLTLEEPGYIWYSFFWMTECDVARPVASRWQIFVDGVADTSSIRTCSPIAAYEMPMCIAGRTSAILSAAAHIVDLRCEVANAGDNVLGQNLQAQGFYVRAY